MNRSLHAALLALAVGVLGPSLGALAPEAKAADAPVPGKVQLDVKVVYATTTHQRVDPGLERLKERMSQFRYSGFELLDSKSLQVARGKDESFSIVGNRRVEVEVLSTEAERARMRLQVLDKEGKKIVDITFSVRRNGEYIVAGPKYKEGVLVLPVKARY